MEAGRTGWIPYDHLFETLLGMGQAFLGFEHRICSIRWSHYQRILHVSTTKKNYGNDKELADVQAYWYTFSAWQNLNGPGFFPQNTTSNIFFVTLTQDQAYRIEAMEDADIKEEAMAVIRSMYGENIPDASHMYVPRWHSDPLYRGTYR